ncbi:hypothetical protein [Actinosynnema sp. NPDC020468]|uniref:hypothetical protein n=1 Tax=Actinosynnema sp. NPDC020468 TaxID=3154488 RepID=UPI00341134F0
MTEHHNHLRGPVFDPVVQARDISGGVHIGATHPVARSRYREYVRQIAPAALVERDAELAALAAFCAAAGPHYLWWRAPKWSGKSALLSWFALHPPPDVRVVSFFVTARLAGQDHRGAFVDVVLEQLAELLGQPLPAFLPESTREAHLVGMLAEAADLCGRREERLVLVVDGLDEDRGAALGGHSIAALLPPRPAPHLRVVVAGRPNPPPPADLDARHPLRDPSIVRALTPSPHALVLRDDMERELDALLRGAPTAQDLLGFVTAAGGGLSDRDLAHLTDQPVAEVRRLLRTSAARSFDVRPSTWRPDRQVYLLGHEDLRATAEDHLGPTRLAHYRDRLHAWADTYRARAWPADSPEYLLRGYHRLLVATGDLDRLIACGTDRARHDRVLDLTGGDLDALTEITTAQDALLTHEHPNLTALARLAVHRDRLITRNSTIPAALPALWALLGEPARAEVLTDPGRNPAAAAHLSAAYSTLGDLDRAEELARAITDLDRQSTALVALVKAAAAAGEFARAEAAVVRIRDVIGKADAEFVLIRALLLASRTPTELMERELRQRALVRNLATKARAAGRWEIVVEAYAAIGEFREARRTVDSIPNAGRRIEVKAALARFTADPELLAQARTEAREADLTGPTELLVAVTAEIGDREQAEALAATLEDPSTDTLLALGTAAAVAGDIRYARDVATRVERATRSTVDTTGRDHRALLLAHARAGREEVAREMIAAETDPSTVVCALLELGDLDAAERVAILDGGSAADLDLVVDIAAARGDHDRAERLALAHQDAATRLDAVLRLVPLVDRDRVPRLISLLPHEFWRTEAWISVVDGAAAAGIADPDWRVRLLTAVAAATGSRTAVAEAEAVIRRMPNPYARVRAWVRLAGAADHGRDLLARAEIAADTIRRPAHRARAKASVVAALAGLGDHDHALALAGTIGVPGWRAVAETAVVKALAAHEWFHRAEVVAAGITDPRRSVVAHRFLATALAASGEPDRALGVVHLLPEAHRPETLAAIAKAVVAQRLRCDALTDLLNRDAESPDPAVRTCALEALVILAVADRDLARAERTAAAIPDRARQAEVWRDLLDEEEVRRTGRPAARILHLLEWTAALPLAKWHPEVLAAVDREVRG